jgi:hypothetical protein
MEDDLILMGSGNYYIHLDKEPEVKKYISSVIKSNRFPTQDLEFNKGKHLYFAAYYVNPADDRFMYIIRAERALDGYDVSFLYCLNTLTHHFEYIEGKDLYSLIYDPKINQSQVMTSFTGTLIKNE